jgi:outer membrane protein OmpA-like peptidoglycan-associated protein
MELSQRRAQACVNDLVKKGIAAERMRAVGYGETKPVTANSTSAGRAKNRRVEFKLYLPEEPLKPQMTAKSPPESIEKK